MRTAIAAVALVVVVVCACAQEAGTLLVKGTWSYGPNERGTWSAKLTPKGGGIYAADYTAIRAGRELKYAGEVRTDLRTGIAGIGKSASGTFEFSGRYGPDGVARCLYTEVGGKRTGSLTAELPR